MTVAGIIICHKHLRAGQPPKAKGPHRHRRSTPVPKQKNMFTPRHNELKLSSRRKEILFYEKPRRNKIFFASREDFSRLFFYNSFMKKPLCGSTVERRKQEKQYE